MSSIKIVADSTCDLSPELIRDYGITILPLNIVLDMTSYSDGEEISPDEIYVWAQANKRTPKTAAVAFDRGACACKGHEGKSGGSDFYRNFLRNVHDLQCDAAGKGGAGI